MRIFSYNDVKKATDRFRWIVYRNSDVAAYKARFEDGEIVLVKRVGAFSEEKDSFYGEVQLLRRLHHRHVLALKGFTTGHKRSAS